MALLISQSKIACLWPPRHKDLLNSVAAMSLSEQRRTRIAWLYGMLRLMWFAGTKWNAETGVGKFYQKALKELNNDWSLDTKTLFERKKRVSSIFISIA